jgi:hypothetical protein
MSEQTQITEQTASPVETTSTPTETKTETTQQPISSTTTQPNTVAKSWKETISEEFRNDPNIAKFTEIDALAKSYINATRMIGSDKVIVPNQNSNEDHWNEVYDKLGRPQSPDKYKFEIKSDVVPFEETSIKQFAENAHKLGLNNKQAQGILEFYKNNVEQSAKQSQIDIETSQAQSQQQLRQEWGRAYDEKLTKAKSIAQANFSKELLNTQLKDGTVLGDNPEIIKGFANIANLLSEDKIISTESESVNQGRDIQTEISKIMDDKSGPYWNKSHPDHSKMVQQMFTLREMLNGK